MSEQKTDHEIKLERVWLAIKKLLERGESVTKSAVARLANIERTTLYTDHTDWARVNEAIDKKNWEKYPELELATGELSEQKKWRMEIQRLSNKLKTLEDAYGELQGTANNVYDSLIRQIHGYMVAANELPIKQKQDAERLVHYNELLARINVLETRNKQLEAQQALPDNVRPLNKKEPIDVNPVSTRRLPITEESLFNAYVDAVEKIADYFHDKSRAPKVVYVMCGLFASGKSRWINKHTPEFVGTVLYLDGTAHTRAMRKMAVTRIKKLDGNCRIVCCLIKADVETCIDRNKDENRRKLGMSVPESAIRDMSAAYQEVGYDEGFDAIEIVTVKK